LSSKKATFFRVTLFLCFITALKINGLEAVQENMRDVWHEEVSLLSIRQVLAEMDIRYSVQ
jgi:hypothetical protein